jgi:hypothetical protein
MIDPEDFQLSEAHRLESTSFELPAEFAQPPDQLLL